ncbi:MAG TPA: FtsX-like permease family protein [Chitinophagales bacterium]|nr:FtsX-like permease family protein [Chitinophagales bacterium]
MNLAARIAKRYLVSKKSTNAINIIAGVSTVGMMVGTAALILVLSVFNGFEDLVTSLYNTFNPDIKVLPAEGKTFEPDSATLLAISAVPGVKAVAQVLEENALLRYKNKDYITRLKGVNDAYKQVTAIDTAIIEGSYRLTLEDADCGLLGLGVVAALGINLDNQFARVQVFMPRREGKVSTFAAERAFTQASFIPTGVFAIQQDFDAKYAIVPIRFMRNLLSYDTALSGLEIALEPNAKPETVKKNLKAVLGNQFIVQDRYEQDAFLYKVMKTEKWAVYFILTFILVISAFNIIGSLSMLVIEKKQDIGILKAMGATKSFIRKVFLMEGILLSLIGATVGVVLAVAVCLAQQHFKLIKLQGASFLIEAYPVSMRTADFVLVFITVVVISVLASVVPAHRAAEQSQLLKEE